MYDCDYFVVIFLTATFKNQYLAGQGRHRGSDGQLAIS